jgi:hypothetical protein
MGLKEDLDAARRLLEQQGQTSNLDEIEPRLEPVDADRMLMIQPLAAPADEPADSRPANRGRDILAELKDSFDVG